MLTLKMKLMPPPAPHHWQTLLELAGLDAEVLLRSGTLAWPVAAPRDAQAVLRLSAAVDTTADSAAYTLTLHRAGPAACCAIGPHVRGLAHALLLAAAADGYACVVELIGSNGNIIEHLE